MSDTVENIEGRAGPRRGTWAWALTGRRFLPVACAVLAPLAALWFVGVPGNPPGFFVDESSVAYNAHLIARDGRDEHGAAWPLYFRAFGEYKNPVYIYLLAALFKLTGPSIGAARTLSAVLGVAAALLLGLLAERGVRAHASGVDGGGDEAARAAGLAVALSALLTPWLFEISRLVFEVALTPLALALLLLALRSSRESARWTWRRSAAVALALTLITYSSSVGRLLAPLFALGLVLFVREGGGWRRVVLRTWLLYAATLLPLLAFALEIPGALGTRFTQVSFITPEMTWADIALRFLRNYVGGFNLRGWLVAGDPESRHHVQTMGSLLAPTVVAAAAGLVLVLRRWRGDAWWLFVVYGLAVSPLPSALTIDHFHTLRLIGLPVFLLLLAAPAFAWLSERGTRARRAAFVALVALTLLQGAVFRRQFDEAAPRRWRSFDAFYPEVFAAATARPERPVYLIDSPGADGYIHGYWYATLAGLDTRDFVRLRKEVRPPPGSLVISSKLPCTSCRMILERGSFRAYIEE